MNFSEMTQTISIIFCMLFPFMVRIDDTKFCFDMKIIRAFFKRGLVEAISELLLSFIYLKIFFKNLELGLLLSLQGDSIGSNRKFHKGSLFFL